MAQDAIGQGVRSEAPQAPMPRAAVDVPRDDTPLLALQARLTALDAALAEALDQQAATNEILQAISRSPNDAGPVFEAIVRHAVRLCGGLFANVFRYDGERLHFVACAEAGESYVGLLHEKYPMAPDRSQVSGRVVLEGDTVILEDAWADAEYDRRFCHLGWHRMLGVPLKGPDQVLGVIVVGWSEAGPVPPRQAALLTTFAEQAAVAIGGARLFEALQERNRALAKALEQQTVTGEILQVISRSPSDVQPVFDTIARAALQLCGSVTVIVFRYDGALLHIAALALADPGLETYVRPQYPRPPGRDTGVGRVVLSRRVVQIEDVVQDPDYALQEISRWGVRSVLCIPLLRDGEPIGAFSVSRREPGPFPAEQAALLQTFADQAVIALQNVNLFHALDARNRELTQALEQQTATGEILRATARSPSNVQAVFDAIVQNAARLCEAQFAFVLLEQDGRLQLSARTDCTPEFAAFLAQGKAADGNSTTGRAALSRRTVQVLDFLAEPGMVVRPAHRAERVRTVLAVPMLSAERLLGVIAVWRREVRAFDDRQVALLETFAAQAVVAIENARLFEALRARTTELTQSVEQLRALGDVGQAVGSTLDLDTVLETIVSRAVELAGMEGGVVYEYDEAEEAFHLRATFRLPEALADALRAPPIPKGEGAVGQLALHGEPVQIEDTLDPDAYRTRVRELVLHAGYRSLLAVPLLREDRLLGGLVVHRRTAGCFEPRVVELLKAFATQSALAIQNARLFREIEAKGRELEVASRHKSAFLANMSHELRTPLNAIIGFTRIVMRKSQDRLEPRQLDNLEKILSSATHLLSLINAVLDLAKVEAGRIELHPVDVLPAEALEACARTVEPLLKDGVVLERDFAPALPAMRVDDEKLRQIVINLLSNAAKFTAAGRVALRARAAGDAVEVEVEDTGIGIPADRLERIFEEFEQADASTTRLHGGTGLGLAIARRLARLMGGDIAVRSAPGAGSTFTLRLPRRAADG